jgi:site-specific recombinase XerD
LCATTIQKIYTQSKHKARVIKIGGIHALRHAYATHLLEAGVPVHHLQQLMGHRSLRSTLRYVHWVPRYHPNEADLDLIAKLEGTHD